MILKTSTKEFCLYGSANPTFSGMLSTPAEGNLELCVFLESKHEHYCNLIENDSMVINQIDMEQIRESYERPDVKSKSKIIDIDDAYLDGRKLNLELNKSSRSSSIVLGHADGTSLSIPFSTQEKKFHINLNEEQFSFCSKPTHVQILFQKHHQQMKSSKRWISTQALELTPKRADIDRILKTRGRSGLILFLNKLKKLEDNSSWFYYFLTILRFEDLDTLDSIRRRLVQRRQEIEVENEYKTPPEINLKAIFERKFEKTKKSIQKSLQQMDEFDQNVFENQFELFLTYSRFIFWLTQEKPKSIDHLRFIRANIEAFLKLHDRFKQNRDFVNHLDESSFWQHLLLLSFLMLSFQKKAGFWQSNLGVANVFKKTTTYLISRFENKSKFTKEDFESVVKVYSEFENLEIDLNKMDRFYTEEFSKKIF